MEGHPSLSRRHFCLVGMSEAGQRIMFCVFLTPWDGPHRGSRLRDGALGCWTSSRQQPRHCQYLPAAARTTRPADNQFQLTPTEMQPLTSITMRPDLLAIMTAFSSSNAILQTDSAGFDSSRSNWPVCKFQTLARPSLPPLTIRVLSN